MQIISYDEALRLMDGFPPPDAQDYTDEQVFHEELADYMQNFMETAHNHGFDVNALSLLAGSLCDEYDKALQELTRLNTMKGNVERKGKAA